MNKIYLVRYIDENTIEGFVYKKADFKNWLKAENKQRKSEGSDTYMAYEFELVEIYLLN